MTDKAKKLVIFDLDDTLINTSKFYSDIKEVFLNSDYFSLLNRSDLEKRFERIEAKNIPIWDHSVLRYKKTMFDLYTELVEEKVIKRSNELELHINDIGDFLLKGSTPDILSGAIELISSLKDHCTQIIVTRGDERHQQRKIKSKGLSKYFNKVAVVPTKNAAVYLEQITKMGFTPEQTWIIGDSKNSDIKPAVEIGANAIHYQFRTTTSSWSKTHDDAEINTGYLKAQSLKEVREILENELGIINSKNVRKFVPVP